MGLYEITVTGKISVPINYTPSSPFEEQTISVTILVRVNPCLVDSFDVISDPIDPIDYTLGTPSVTFGPYEFAQSPDCGYPVTITFVNLDETFINHDPVLREFTIQQTDDLTKLGIYQVGVRATFDQPDYTGAVTPVSNLLEFDLTVRPCTVTSFDITSDIVGPVRYVLGTPDLDFGPYGFQQTPDCGYAETVIFQDLPLGPSLIHDSVNQDFTIVENSDNDLVGVYNVEIEASFD